MSAAEQHRETAGAFTATVDGVAPGDWDLPAPPQGWVARDVVRHLTQWFPTFLEGNTDLRLPAGPSVETDPAGAWRAQTTAIQELLDDPATADQEHEFAHIGTMTLADAAVMIYTSDVFLHRWDLAVATGQDDTLDPHVCSEMVAGMEPLDDVLRASGHYGPKIAVPQDADAQTKLLGFIGRSRER